MNEGIRPFLTLSQYQASKVQPESVSSSAIPVTA